MKIEERMRQQLAAKANGVKVLPPSVAYCVAKGTYLSGSEFYRAHRPAHVLGHSLNWLTFLATHFRIPEKAGETWQIVTPFPTKDGVMDERIVTPKVIITRPIWALEDDDNATLEGLSDSISRITDGIAYAQESGQIVIADLDDHPYGWNEEYADKENSFRIDDWNWHDNWLAQCNGVLCSTRYLQKLLARRFPQQLFAYAPNLYDPFRYEDCTPKFGKTLGSHLFMQARFRDDFQRFDQLLPLFDLDPELTFHHLGEEYKCEQDKCRHAERDHLDGYCKLCACESYTPGDGLTITRYTPLSAKRVTTSPASSLMDLPQRLDWNVGIVPLADNEWNYCKTEGKGFEMAAAGIPFVALTGHHPLYSQSPGNAMSDAQVSSRLHAWTTNEKHWTAASGKFRRWSHRIAQEHQDDYIKCLDGLSKIDLRK